MAPGDPAARFEVDPERFEELVAEALDSIPERLGRLMENVAVIVEDHPSAAQQARRRGERGLLLGLYEGVDLTRRSPLSYTSVLPDRITVFREALCTISRDEADLTHNVRVTVIHEVAHHFGIDDRRLAELGWA